MSAKADDLAAIILSRFEKVSLPIHLSGLCSATIVELERDMSGYGNRIGAGRGWSGASVGQSYGSGGSSRDSGSVSALTDQISRVSVSGQQPAGPSSGSGKGKAGDAQPPRYDEIYNHDGEFLTKSGKHKLMADDRGRAEHMAHYGMNQNFIHPTSEEAGAAYNKKIIYIADDSGSMGNMSTREEVKVVESQKKILGFKTKKTKIKEQRSTITETITQEQMKNMMDKLMPMQEAYSSRYPSLWMMNGPHLEGHDVNSVSPQVRDALSHTRRGTYEHGGTPGATTLLKVKEYEEKTGDTSPISIKYSSDGENTDIIHGDRTQNRKYFEDVCRDLAENGITVQTENGPVNRDVTISIQYIGDDDAPYKPQKPYFEKDENGKLKRDERGKPIKLSRKTDPEAYYAARLTDFRENASTAAWTSAIENARKGGIKKMDQMDDDESELQSAEKATGLKISKKDLDLKRLLGSDVVRLDILDESSASDSE